MLGTTNDEAMANGNPRLMRLAAERVMMRLDHEPQTMWTSDDRAMLAFTGRIDDGATPLTVFVPKPEDEELSPEIERSLREIGGGDTVTLTGRWQYQDWPDVSGRPVAALSFFAEEFVRGDVPRPGLRTLTMPSVVEAPDGPSAIHGGMGIAERRAFAFGLIGKESTELLALATDDLAVRMGDVRDDRAEARIQLVWHEFERRSELHMFRRAENEACLRLGREVAPHHIDAARSEADYRASLGPKFQAAMREQWAKNDRLAQGM